MRTREIEEIPKNEEMDHLVLVVSGGHDELGLRQVVVPDEELHVRADRLLAGQGLASSASSPVSSGFFSWTSVTSSTPEAVFLMAYF